MRKKRIVCPLLTRIEPILYEMQALLTSMCGQLSSLGQVKEND